MKPLLTAFIDGLKPESLEYMPFLNSFSTKRRIKTELGFSPTCYASMYSGVYPNKHLHWFTWKYSPNTSSFKWIKKFRVDKFPHNIFTKFACHKITASLDRSIKPLSGMGFPWWYTPIQYWHYFDVAIKKFWNEPNYIGNYPSVFDLLRANNIQYEIVGIEGALDQSSEVIEQYTFDEIKPWTYFFIGDIDPLSHEYGQDSDLVIERLKKIDSILSEKCGLLEKKIGAFSFMLFSDHGHIKVGNDRINLKSFFSSCGERLDDYIYCIDANYARFWFKNEGENRRVFRVLSEMSDKGFILTEEHFKKYNVTMPDNRYGDLIFYLDVPYIFDRGTVIAGKKFKSKVISSHGFLPDYPDSDGVFISNKKVEHCSHVELVDIMPSILDILGLEIPSYVDGRTLWK